MEKLNFGLLTILYSYKEQKYNVVSWQDIEWIFRIVIIYAPFIPEINIYCCILYIVKMTDLKNV